MTPAARRKPTGSPPHGTGPEGPHNRADAPRGQRRTVAPRGLTSRALRRVSGPAGGRLGPPPAPPSQPAARAAAPARPVAPGRKAPARPVRPARPAPATVPSRTSPKTASKAAPRTAAASGAASALAAQIRSLPDHRLLDRLVRGRAWIPVLGLMLAGIVAMQVEVLKLGTAMGRNLERGQALQSRNEILRARVAGLADEGRIERLAERMGMVMPGPSQITFLPLGSGGAVRASAAVHPPDASNFAIRTEGEGALAGVLTGPAAPSAPGAP